VSSAALRRLRHRGVLGPVPRDLSLPEVPPERIGRREIVFVAVLLSAWGVLFSLSVLLHDKLPLEDLVTIVDTRETPPPPPPPPPLPAELYNQEAPVMPQLDLPDLSNDQREKIRLSDIEHLKTMTPLRNQVSEKKARLQTVLTTSPYDAKSSDLVVEELGKIETMIMKEMIRHDQALRNLLTPDQQVIFDSRLKPFLCKGK